MYLRYAVGERRRRGGCGNVGRAHKHLDTNGAVVDLDTIQGGGGLDSLLVLVEEDRGAAEAATSRTILQHNLLRPTDTSCSGKVLLWGALVAVIGKSLRGTGSKKRVHGRQIGGRKNPCRKAKSTARKVEYDHWTRHMCATRQRRTECDSISLPMYSVCDPANET